MNPFFRIRVLGVFTGLLCGAIACGGSEGSYLVDGGGRSLYYFGKDLPSSGSNAAVSNCSGGCAAAWPIFHAAGSAVQGISAGDVGEITRPDGSKQTTYRGWPLYFFAGDVKAGDVNGEGVDDVWFVMHDQQYSVALMSNAAGQEPKLYLSSGEGRSLYYFFRDTQGTASTAPVSACASATCLASWLIFHAGETVIPSSLAQADFTVRGRGVNNAWDTLDPTAL